MVPEPPLTAGPAASTGGAGPALSCRHGGRTGSFDETARRARHEELAVANVLVAEGHAVRSVPERRGARTPDLLACGTSVEVKSFQSLRERAGRPPTPKGVANKILDARGQAAVAVIWAGDSGLSQATARAGYQLSLQRALQEGPGRLRDVRVIGEGFQISFSLASDVRLARRPALRRAGPRLSPGGG